MPVKTSLKENKRNKKANSSILKFRSSGNGVKGKESKRKGVRISKKVLSRQNSGDDVDGVKSSNGKQSSKLRMKGRRKEVEDDANERFMPGSGNKSLNPRMKDEQREGRNGRLKLGTLNRKRKRVSADGILHNVDISNVNNHKENVLKRTQTKRVESFNLEQFGLRSTMAGKMKSKASESVEKKKLRGLSKVKAVEEVEYSETDGMLKKRGKSLSGKKQFDQNQSEKGVHTVKRSAKKKVQGKKNTTDDAEEREQKPKKKKRIRLDPYDTSNKRLDDGFAINDGEEKKGEMPTTSEVELSKNAQFRAIRPSPSVLSFVEDNLLGRRREIEIKSAGYNIELSAPLDNIPFSTSTDRERIEEPVFRNKLSFFAAAKVSSSFPPPELPEIAFAGRSNVGKSSLLNSLTRQWGVVRTSDKPGLTQTINFFKLGSKLCLVDLPGYGFAYAKEEVKEAWEELVKEYVSTRVGLKRVCLLVDTKWGMKPRDYELVDLMERSQTKYQIVLTKTDLVFPIDVARRAMQIEESLKQKKSAVQPVMMVSSKSGAGIRSLRTVLSKIARFVKP